ncbi:MAG: hypothetical protein RDV48_02840 [Candidatus Eremiobacteraeota bacterium]|nr:hypothetical protein [Candidatus Eremiobacteraeota bacterium]
MSFVNDYIAAMHRAPREARGYDAIIISTNSPHEARYWQERLEATRGMVSNCGSLIFSCYEDWNSENGAGNLLGTLYAWEKAEKLMREQSGTTLLGFLESGKSVAMYHIAGLGTRLAPLPGSECNSKSAVKLPSLLTVNGTATPLTILEAVILQTGPFAATRPGRLSVWWGDQVFIPARYKCPGTHHVEMLAKKVPLSRELENYGLLIFQNHGDAKLREKMPLERIKESLRNSHCREAMAGISLGSFSISTRFLQMLLAQYQGELSQKTCRLNTDADLWQPLTSLRDEYRAAGRSEANWDRVKSFMESFSASCDEGIRPFGAIDTGDSYWWDYGQLALYQENLLKLLENSAEGEAMRLFYQVPSPPVKDSWTDATEISGSVVLGSHIGSGRVKNSIVIKSWLHEADIEDCIVIESAVMGSLSGRRALSYHDTEESGLRLEYREASAGIYLPPKTHHRMRVIISENGKEHWRHPIHGNALSFSEVWQIMKETARGDSEALFRERWKRIAAPL